MGKTIPGMSGKPVFKGLHSVAQLDRSREGSDGYPEQHSSVVRPKVFSSWNPAFTFPDLFGAEVLLWLLMLVSAISMEFQRWVLCFWDVLIIKNC